METENKLFEYDKLKMYFGEPYKVTDKITIYQPTLGDILEFGEEEFYSIVYAICSNTTMYRLILWENGIDWNEFSDFELFINIMRKREVKETKLLFGDLDFTKFFIVPDDDGGLRMIYSLDPEIQIDELIYIRIVDYIRTMFDIHPKVEKARNKATKEAIIEEEKMKIENEQILNSSKGSNNSVLFSLVSSMINHPGFKYKKSELKEVGIVEFMDSVKRLQTYESVKSFMSGIYSGMIDTSKIDLNKELNWTRDLYED